MAEQIETIKILAQLFTDELRPAPVDVTIYNQKSRIPPSDGLFVNVNIIGDKLFGTSSRAVIDPEDPGAMIDQASMNVQETFQVDVFSADGSARIRKKEIVFALLSQRAQKLAEQHAFKLGLIPTSFLDLSRVEATSRLNWYAITFNALRAYSQSRAIESFTTFQVLPQFLTVNP